MVTVLLLSIVPALLAAGLGSAGLALIAAAGLLWAAALFACSRAPVVEGRAASLNESFSTGLSVLATAAAAAGVILVLLNTL